jgi:hypothetical protein
MITLISYEYNGSTEVTSGFNTYVDGGNYTFGSNQWVFDYNSLTSGNNFGTEAIAGGQDRFVTMTVIPEPNVAALIGGFGECSPCCVAAAPTDRPAKAHHDCQAGKASSRRFPPT